jgi:hypothetical protein
MPSSVRIASRADEDRVIAHWRSVLARGDSFLSGG